MDDPLALDAETMRRYGYRTVDLLVERLTDPDTPALLRAAPGDMEARLSGPPPAAGEPFEAVLGRLADDVLPFASRTDHPGFFAFVPGAGTWPGALGDFVASALNVYAGSWMESAGPSRLELEVLHWFAGWLGYGDEAAGVLTTGGSAANLAALACARQRLAGTMSPDLVAYVSDQGHSSVARAARLLGFAPGQLRVLPSDEAQRLRPELLAAAMDSDLGAGRRPLLVSANAGATNTGAIDPLPELAALCRKRGVWLHADAAYGGFAVLTDRGREALRGIELADSIALDPHKWLYQPYECGCLLVRDGAALRSAFEITADYLRDATPSADEVNFADLGIQLTRTSRALKLWLSLRTFGLDAFRAAIDRSLDLAANAARRIESSHAFELAAPTSLGVVCFRRRFEGVDDVEEADELNARLPAVVEQAGVGLISSTRVSGRYALRMCVLNHTTARPHVDAVLDVLERCERPAATPALPTFERHLAVGSVSRDGGSENPLGPHLSPAEARLLADLGTERRVARGETILRQWDASRDFYVVAHGAVEVIVDGEPVGRLETGDFFGELAALDWGAGFGYPRLASVVAATDARLLVFAEGSFERLLEAAPGLARAVRQAVRERLEQRR